MDESISQFVAVTGADAERAHFFVEAAKGDVEQAVATYFETGGDASAGEAGSDEGAGLASAVGAASTVADAPTGGPRTLSGAPAPPMPSDWAAASGSRASSSSKPSVTRGGAGSGSSRFASLSDFRGDGRGGTDDDDDDDDDDRPDPANFFAGGERSGLNVQNPDRAPRAQAPEMVQNILKKATEAGRRRMEDEGSGNDRASAKTTTFTGAGRTIGDSLESASSRAPDATVNMPSSSGARQAPPDEEEEVAVRSIIFWQDGFSIADGPLMRYDDPQHAETLRLINNNRAPLHLLNVRFDQPVELRVEQRTNEKYQPPPPPPMKPFGGEGNRLGSPAPAIAGANARNLPAESSGTAAPALQIDESQPITSLQIRLSDGQRIIGRFNHAHTVADVRNYINASRPGMDTQPYTLQTSFPPKPLTDESQSLKDAGLINAVVIQKLS